MTIDTSDEAVARLCRDITVADGEPATALIRALCAERDEAVANSIETACDPYKNCTGGPPDWESPLQNVWQAACCWTMDIVGGALGADNWERGDGSESIDGDIAAEVRYIMRAAGLVNDDGDIITKDELSSLRAKVAADDHGVTVKRAELLRKAMTRFGISGPESIETVGLNYVDYAQQVFEVALRAKGCGVSEEQRKALLALRDRTTETAILDYSGGQGRTVSGQAVDAIDALLQSAPQAAKLAAPMDKNIAELVARLRARKTFFSNSSQWTIADADCQEAANALESLSRPVPIINENVISRILVDTLKVLDTPTCIDIGTIHAAARQIAEFVQSEGLSRRNEGDGWRTDLEHAPKDRFIFLHCAEDNSRWLASWQGQRWHGVDELGLTREGHSINDPDVVTGWAVTNWRPLPPPPETAKEVMQNSAHAAEEHKTPPHPAQSSGGARVFDPDCDDIRDLVYSVPAPSDEQIKVGTFALDQYYDGTKDAELEGSVAHVYRAMKALEPSPPEPSDAAVEALNRNVIARILLDTLKILDTPTRIDIGTIHEAADQIAAYAVDRGTR